MSSFNRRLFLLSSMALAGCGFTPVYGPSGAGRALRGAVEVDAPSDREAHSFAQAATRSLGEALSPHYRLGYEITTDEKPIGLTRDQEIKRYHVTGKVTYTLIDIASGNTVASGTVERFTAYAATGSTVASLSATSDAYDRLMSQLADAVVLEMTATFGEAR